jgi:predicted glycosyl hydrolase (DUF1957 family)
LLYWLQGRKEGRASERKRQVRESDSVFEDSGTEMLHCVKYGWTFLLLSESHCAYAAYRVTVTAHKAKKGWNEKDERQKKSMREMEEEKECEVTVIVT